MSDNIPPEAREAARGIVENGLPDWDYVLPERRDQEIIEAENEVAEIIARAYQRKEAELAGFRNASEERAAEWIKQFESTRREYEAEITQMKAALKLADELADKTHAYWDEDSRRTRWEDIEPVLIAYQQALKESCSNY